MSEKKLFLGGLSWGISDDGLRDAFEKFGEVVEAKVITDRETGRSRGFGFVTLAEQTQADAAVKALHSSVLRGRKITVRTADGGAGGCRGGSGGTG